MPQLTNIRSLSSLTYISGLDGLRAIAILLVVAHHYLSPFKANLQQSLAGLPLLVIAKIGWIGVDIFFVISGFLIARVLARRPPSSFASLKHFIAARAWRLLPAYVACVVLFLMVAAISTPNSQVLINSWSVWTLSSNLQSAFGNRTALMDAHYSLVHFWSLAVEWHFYLLFACCVWLFKSQRFTAWTMLVLAIICRTLLQKNGFSDNAIYAFSVCRFDAFAIGVLIAHARPMSQVRKLGLAGALLLLVMLSLIVLAPEPYKKISWLQQYGYSLIALGTGMVLLWAIQQPESWLMHYLESRWLVYIGQRSYSIYLWHLVFFPGIANWVAGLGLPASPTIALIFMVNCATTALLTVCFYQGIELKCYRWFRQSQAKV
ncbi:acyltransferase family protein [Methylophilus aquaticus]|uniref:Acyltransferase n=1 Tax=Methylophilus aquaticus TaxID=1971610 RepID=A0ABT9JP74_9PROT|nr:acyltransferase [Methylophilus aquaticus]MDP8566368.1 acyltransferase [Methylophilus aquaticus]